MLRKKRIKKNLRSSKYIKALNITNKYIIDKYIKWVETNCHEVKDYYKLPKTKSMSLMDILKPIQLQKDFLDHKRACLESKADRILNKAIPNIGLKRIFDLLFEDQIVGAIDLSQNSIQDLIVYYKEYLNEEELLALKKLGYGEK